MVMGRVNYFFLNLSFQMDDDNRQTIPMGDGTPCINKKFNKCTNLLCTHAGMMIDMDYMQAACLVKKFCILKRLVSEPKLYHTSHFKLNSYTLYRVSHIDYEDLLNFFLNYCRTHENVQRNQAKKIK